MATTDLTLFQVEEAYLAMLDTADLTPGEQQAEFLQELAKTTETAVAKRDSCARFLLFLEHQIEGIDHEIERLTDLKSRYKSGTERFSKYVADIIATFVEQPKRGNKRLDGKLHVLSLAKNPDSIQIEGSVSEEYCDVTLRISGALFRKITDALSSIGEGEIVKALYDRREVLPRKADIKRAIEAGTAVPGAVLKNGAHRLVVR